MKFKLIVYKSFEKDFDKLPVNIQDRVVDELGLLRDNPFPNGSKKLVNREGWRIRIGDYRIMYDVNKALKEVYLRKIAHRKDIYR